MMGRLHRSMMQAMVIVVSENHEYQCMCFGKHLQQQLFQPESSSQLFVLPSAPGLVFWVRCNLCTGPLKVSVGEEARCRVHLDNLGWVAVAMFA